MSQIRWLTDINGSFTNAADWSGGKVPGASDDAILDAVGSSFTVTSNLIETVNSVQLAANATLSLTGHTFTATDGTGAGSNAGVILVGAGATLETEGNVKNTGTIALNGAGGGKDASTLLLNGLYTTLSGGGDILLGSQGHNAIKASPGKGSAALLYNLDNTIAGSGVIAKHVLVYNGGVIDASGASSLVVRDGISNNSGVVEATGSGGLVFKDAFMQSYVDGVVLEAPGSRITFDHSGLDGGTLEAPDGGTVVMHDSGLGGYPVQDPFTIDANVKIVGTLAIYETIVNNGTMSLFADRKFADRNSFAYVFLQGSVTLEGDGDIDLRRGEIVGGDRNTLTLASGTISGPGQISQREDAFFMTIGMAGVIDSNANGKLTLNANAIIVNGGLIESTGKGGILVDDAIVNTGTLTVQSGTFKVEGAVSGSGVAIIGGGTLDFGSTVDQGVTFTGGGVLELGQSRQFKDAVTGFSTSGATTLDLGDIKFVDPGEGSFSGTVSGGVLTVTDGTHTANINLVGDYLGATFVASSDGKKGVDIVATGGQTPSAAHFVSAMAAMTGHGEAAGLIDARGVNDGRQMMLAMPRLAIA
jgi:hypothetical protein